MTTAIPTAMEPLAATQLFVTLMPSPIGELRVGVDGDGALVRIDFAGHRPELQAAHRDDRRCDHVVAQLREYFAGARTDFDLALAPQGTPFQLAAWRALLEIPFAATRSYQQQAVLLGKPSAMRAVGAANGKNPIPIVVPCHRVIGKDGSLTGFGGGLDKKRWLLEHERRVAAGAAIAD